MYLPLLKNALLCLFLLFQAPLFAQENYKDVLKSAQAKINDEKYEEAIPLLDKAIAFKSKVAENYYLKSLCLRKSDKQTEAIPVIEEAIKRDKNQWKYYKLKGDCLYNTSQFEAAIAEYSKAIETEKTKKNDTLWQYRADGYLKLERFQLAIDDYSKAIAINSKNRKLYFDRAFMYKQLSDKEKACSDYQKAYQMGQEVAKSEAYTLLKCEWAKPPARQRDDAAVEISKVEVEGFTGAVITSKGLTYEKFEIVKTEGDAYITRPDFAYDEEFAIEIKYPKGFLAENGKVQPGIAFKVYEGEKDLGGSENILGELGEFSEEELSDLKIKLTLSKPLEMSKNYRVSVRFFDRNSNKEVLFAMPFQVKERTSSHSQISRSTRTDGSQISTSYTEQKLIIDRVYFKDATKASIDPQKLVLSKSYVLEIVDMKGFEEQLLYEYAWINAKDGKRSPTTKGNRTLGKSVLRFDLNKPTNKGDYFLWLSLRDKKNEQQIWNLVQPVKIN